MFRFSWIEAAQSWPKSHNRPGINPLRAIQAIVLAGATLILFMSEPAFAHHPMGGQTPDSFVSGFLSGVGHPIIGLDHFVFVIAIGLLAATQKQGLGLPLTFCITSLFGTGLHLAALDLPAPERIIALSVLAMGALLARKGNTPWQLSSGLGAIAGLFHGYAYGESIVGAQITPLLAYLLGFTLIQVAITYSAYFLVQRIGQQPNHLPVTALRLAGFTICGIGLTLVSSLILN